ncbi:MAG: hydroxypyruvate isomerase, partial [Flavobacterium sp.]
MIAGTTAIGVSSAFSALAIDEEKKEAALKGNINHSACRWCYADIPLDELCLQAKKIGLKGIDLVGPKEWETLK